MTQPPPPDISHSSLNLSPGPHRGGLSSDLRSLLDHANGQDVTYSAMLQVLGDRGHAVLILLLAFPFLIPTPPGFSTIAGSAIIFLAISLMLGMRPWLPGFVRRRSLGHATLAKIIDFTLRLFAKVERFIRPRLGFMLSPVMKPLAGLSMLSLGFLLSLPIPIPWNNGPPAIGILILGLGLLERDGLLIIAGHIYNLLLLGVMILAGDYLWGMFVSILNKFW